MLEAKDSLLEDKELSDEFSCGKFPELTPSRFDPVS